MAMVPIIINFLLFIFSCSSMAVSSGWNHFSNVAITDLSLAKYKDSSGVNIGKGKIVGTKIFW